MRAEGFSCSLDVIFSLFLVIKPRFRIHWIQINNTVYLKKIGGTVARAIISVYDILKNSCKNFIMHFKPLQVKVPIPTTFLNITNITVYVLFLTPKSIKT
jgi:hypothetical protein